MRVWHVLLFFNWWELFKEKACSSLQWYSKEIIIVKVLTSSILKLLQVVHLRPSETGEDILLLGVDQHRQSSEPITAIEMRWPASPHSWRAERLPVREGQDWQGRVRIYSHFSSASIGAPYRDGQLTEYPAIKNKVFHREAVKAENTLCTIPNVAVITVNGC